MAVREIITLPDPILKQPAEPVEEITPKIKQLFTNLSDTTDASPGFALAAPQIGVLKRVICVDVDQAKRDSPTNHGKVILYNPQVEEGKDPVINREGCLSIPSYTGDVRRFQEIEVSGYNLEGEKLTLNSQGWEAVAFQHEIDHLDGILFLDRITSIEDDLFHRK